MKGNIQASNRFYKIQEYLNMGFTPLETVSRENELQNHGGCAVALLVPDGVEYHI